MCWHAGHVACEVRSMPLKNRKRRQGDVRSTSDSNCASVAALAVIHVHAFVEISAGLDGICLRASAMKSFAVEQTIIRRPADEDGTAECPMTTRPLCRLQAALL